MLTCLIVTKTDIQICIAGSLLAKFKLKLKTHLGMRWEWGWFSLPCHSNLECSVDSYRQSL